MPRPIKQGIDYWPMDVNFLKDVKVRKIMRACGPDSPTILISLLSNIYGDYGYFVVWDNDMPFLVADEVGASEGAVCEVVKKALQVDFFDIALYEKYKILTSKGIQKRFIKAIERRKHIDIISNYCLMDANNIINVNINLINDDSNKQRKEKEIKEKYIPPFIPPRGEEGKKETQAEKTKKELRLIRDAYIFNPELDTAVNCWIKYKHERKQGYKPQGLKSFLTQVKNNAEKYGDIALIDIINSSMASNYKGVTWDKLKANYNPSKPQQPRKKPRFANYDAPEKDFDKIEQAEAEYLKKSLGARNKSAEDLQEEYRRRKG